MRSRNEARKNKHRRIRSRISGTPLKPRLCVFKSLAHFEAQLVDDVSHKVLLSTSTKTLNLNYGGNVLAASALGAKTGKKIKQMKVTNVVFDRAGYVYHGRVAAFAAAVRKEGINF